MDPGSYVQSARYQEGMPVYYSRASLAHQPVYQSFQQAAQTPVYNPSHPLPVGADNLYTQPPQVNPGGMPPSRSAAYRPPGIIQYHSTTAMQGQPLSYMMPSNQPFTIPTANSKNLYRTSPPPPLATPPPVALPPFLASTAEKADGQSWMSWSTTVSPPSSTGFNFTNRGPAYPGSGSVTSMSNQAANYVKSSSSHTSINFLQAASQHGIKVESPKLSMSSASSEAQTVVEPSSISLSASSQFGQMQKSSGNVLLDRQDLVNYYVNKHESLSNQEVWGKEVKKETESCQDEEIIYGESLQYSDQKKHADQYSSERQEKSETENDVSSKVILQDSNRNNNAKAYVSGDKNSNVLSWLSKSEALIGPDDGSDLMKVEEKNDQEKMQEKKQEVLSEDVTYRSETLASTYITCSTEDRANIAGSNCDDSTDIFIEEHEFLSKNLDTSALEDESFVSCSDKSDVYDEVDGGEMNASFAVGLKKKNVLCCKGKDTSDDKNSEMNDMVQSVEKGESQDVKVTEPVQEFSKPVNHDENILSKYKQQLKEAENTHIELLATTSNVLEQIAVKVVKTAVARGVLKYLSTLKDGCDLQKNVLSDTSQVKEMEKICRTESETEMTKVLYSCDSDTEFHRSKVTDSTADELEKKEEQAIEIREDLNGENADQVIARSDLKQTEDFEKLFFKQTASKHGITIESPSKTEVVGKLNDKINSKIENQDRYIPEMSNYHKPYKVQSQNLTEDLDSDITSMEGSQSDSGEAFRIKAFEKGILVQDPRDRVEFSTDSDAEVDQSSIQDKIGRESGDVTSRKSTSTPEPCNFTLNSDLPIFKPVGKKRTMSGRLRPEAAEFNPSSLNSSFSLNNSISESDAGEKLDSSLRVEAVEFVPVLTRSDSRLKISSEPQAESELKMDTATFEPKATQTSQSDVFPISTLAEEIRRPAVAVQVCPDTWTRSVGTKRIKTKESGTATVSCECRDVGVNTEGKSDVESECKNVIAEKRAIKNVSKGSNTDMSQRRSVGISVRLKNVEKPLTHSVMTMTDPVLTEKHTGLRMSDEELIKRVKKQDVLLQNMGKLQIELMLFKEKEIKEKICGMKEELQRRMTGVIGLFTDGAEADVLQSMIQSKLSKLEEALEQVQSVTSSTVYQIKAGRVFEELPDFGLVLPQMIKSPSDHSSPKKRTFDTMEEKDAKPGTSQLQAEVSEKQGTSILRFQGNSLQNLPNKESFLKLKARSRAGKETRLCKPGLKTRQSELPNYNQFTTELTSPKSNASELFVPEVKVTSSPKHKQTAETNRELKFPDFNVGSLSLGVSADLESQPDNLVTKFRNNHARQKPSEITSDSLSKEVPSSREIPTTSLTLEVKDKDPDTGNELQDLKMEETVLATCQNETKRRAPRTKGFMELEDSSDDEDDENSAMVVDKLDYDTEKSKEAGTVIEEVSVVTTVAKQSSEMIAKEPIKEDRKSDPCFSENKEKCFVNDRGDGSKVKMDTLIDTLIDDEDEANVETSKLTDDIKKERNKTNDKSSPKLKEADGVIDGKVDGKDFSEDINEGYRMSAMEKLISQKMFTEYGNESRETKGYMNVRDDEIVADSNKTEDKLDNSLDAIDSDENETVVTTEKHEDSNEEKLSDNKIEREPSGKVREIDERSTRVTERFEETINDENSKALEQISASAVSPPGYVDPVLHFDPKEVFVSPTKKGVFQFGRSNESDMLEASASQTALVGPPHGNMGNMPVVMGNMNPVLYQAVLAQLIQAYPELASNQEMLTQVAIQQTGLLQMYVSNQSGGEHKTGCPAIDYGVLGNTSMGMIGISQQHPDTQVETSLSMNEQRNDLALNNSDIQTSGIPSSSLNSSKGGDSKGEQQSSIEKKPSLPPGLHTLSYLSTNEIVEDSKKTPVAPATTFSDNNINETKHVVNEKEKNDMTVMKVGVQSSVPSNTGIKPSTSSTGLDEFELPESYRAESVRLNKNNSALSESMRGKNNSAISEDKRVKSYSALSKDIRVKSNSALSEDKRVESNSVVSDDRTVENDRIVTEDMKNQSNRAVSDDKRVKSINAVSDDKRVKGNSAVLDDNRVKGSNAVSDDNRVKGNNAVSDDKGVKSKVAVLEDIRYRSNSVVRGKVKANSNSVGSGLIKTSTDTWSENQADFLPDFAKRHKPENTNTRVIHHFVPKVSDTVSRAIASSDQVHFERRSPSPISAAEQAALKMEESNFPPLQKRVQGCQDWTGNASKSLGTQKAAGDASSGKLSASSKIQKSQYSAPPNLPPRLRRQSATDNPADVTTYNRNIQQFQIPQQESWEDEVDTYAQTFTLHHNVHKPVTMITGTSAKEKNQKADFTNPFLAQASKDVPKVKSSSSMKSLCDISLSRTAETTAEEVNDEWQEVQSKRRRHTSKEQKKELRQLPASCLNSAPVSSDKQQKKSNFDRLVGRLLEEFPHANKQEIINTIQKIRVERGTLSGLSMEAIIEKSYTYMKPAQKKIPGLWADKKQPVQRLNIATSPKSQPAAKPSDTCASTFEEDICVICHDPLTTDPVKELDCMHVFHSQCISQWVERERTCPTCRKHALFPEEFPRLGK